jgi:hypothetical protein
MVIWLVYFLDAMPTVQPILLSKIFMGQHTHTTPHHTTHTALHFWLGTIWHYTSSCHHFTAHYCFQQVPPICPPCTYCMICMEVVPHRCLLTLVSCWAPHLHHVPLASLHMLCAETHSHAEMPILRASHGTCSSTAKIPTSGTVGRINAYHSSSQQRQPLQGTHYTCKQVLQPVVHVMLKNEQVFARFKNRPMSHTHEFLTTILFLF